MTKNVILNSITDLKEIKGFIIAHLNIRSCLPKIDSLRADLCDANVDVLCLSETWLKSSITDDLVSVDGFLLEHLDRSPLSGHKQGGGVGIYCKASINYIPIKTHWVSNNDIELICITLLPVNSRKMNIINVYRPPKGNVNNALDIIKGVVESLDKRRMDTVVLGDFNIDLNQKSNSAKSALDLFNDLGLTQVINVPTRKGPIRNTLIDHCYIDMLYPSVCERLILILVITN